MFIIGHGFIVSAIAVAAACGAMVLHSYRPRGPADDRWYPPACIQRLAATCQRGEALFTGLLTILIAVYRPAWITTYDVRRYRLDRGPRI